MALAKTTQLCTHIHRQDTDEYYCVPMKLLFTGPEEVWMWPLGNNLLKQGPNNFGETIMKIENIIKSKRTV